MGFSSSKKEKYFNAYKSIKTVLEETHDITLTVDNIYFVNIETIKNYLEILERHEIFNKIINVRERTNIKDIEKKILKELGDYKLEKDIEIIDINFKNINENINKKFILVDKDFLLNMEIEDKSYKGKEHSIIVNKNEKLFELKDENEEKIIINLIEDENKKGIYIFYREESIDLNILSMAEDVKKELEENRKDDPEVSLFRIFKNNEKDITQDKEVKKEENQEKITQDIINNNNNAQGNPKNINKENVNNTQKIKELNTQKASSAKFDEIIYCIYSNLSSTNTEKDKIYEKIRKYISESDMQNELEETGLDIIGNIKTAVIYLIQNMGISNQNLINLNQSQNTYYYCLDQQNNILIDESDEASSLIQSRNIEENHHDNNKQINPFKFLQIKYIDCEKCINKENIELSAEYYIFNLNDECYNIDDCFKLPFFEKCTICNKDMKCYYKFKTTPEILILKFENPKENKKYIKLNEIEKNIDLKNHMNLTNNLKIEYERIKVLYVFNDLNDKKLYVDVPNNEKNNYIPYIIFYKKLNDT